MTLKQAKQERSRFFFMSKLENGHLIDWALPVGSTFQTQWGAREVVEVIKYEVLPGELSIRDPFDEPETVQ
jgi:hypothetical protein